MTMTTHSHQSRRVLDIAGLILLVLGLACGALCYWLIVDHGMNPLLLVPSVAAATTGAAHVTKRQAPRD